ncbi:MAG TPA: alkaline shock response membrane anchor protein AmaP [Candidatus Eisenbacteria bacterium]|nr:alkaline shock response membrane anchor protein AmaP [Candidatus Eisenbacteria bacterium]
MNRLTRFMQIVLYFFLALLALIFIASFINQDLMSGVITILVRVGNQPRSRIALIVLFAMIFVAALSSLVRTILSGRLRKARVTEGQMGVIDIGVDAIESVALNAAQSAQAGVKAAKAHIAPFKNNKLSVRLSVMAYSNVELPAMMARVQERVKKDIERYTGIEVAEVIIKVSRVDTIATRVDS